MKSCSIVSRVLISLAVFAQTQASAQEVSSADVLLLPAKLAPPVHKGNGKVATYQAQIAARQPAGPLPLDQIDTDQASAAVGHGYDPATGRILPMLCVLAKAPDFTLGSGAIVVKKKSLVSDEKSYSHSSGSSVGFSAVIKAVSIGASASQAHSTSFNSVDSYGRLFNRIATAGVERTTVQWSPDALKLLQKADLTDFLTQCGTRFVRGVYSGQQLDTLVSFVLRQNSSASANATSVSVGVAKIFNASGSFSSAAAEADQYADSYIENNGKGALGVAILAASAPGGAAGGATSGGAGAPSPVGGTPPVSPPAPSPGGSGATSGGSATTSASVPDLQALLSYYENGFAAAVEKAVTEEAQKVPPKSSAMPLYIIADHYQGNLLPLAEKLPMWADGIYNAISAKADTYNTLISEIEDLTSALKAGPNVRLGVFYKDDTVQTASKKLSDAKLKLAAFQGAVQRCQQLIAAGQEMLPGSHSAVDQCSQDLEKNLNDTDVAMYALARNY